MEFAGAGGGFAEGGHPSIPSTPENIKALHFMRDLVWEHEISPPSTYTEMKEKEARHFFLSGNTLFERNWPYAWALHQSEEPELANRLLEGIHSYTRFLHEPRQPVKLVDSTGFSLQSIKTVFNAYSQEGIKAETWNADSLFSQGNRDLQSMMGVLLRVPELRENLNAVTGGRKPDGDKLALILKDWVNGVSVREIAARFFMDDKGDIDKAMTTCGQNLFGRLTPTAA